MPMGPPSLESTDQISPIGFTAEIFPSQFSISSGFARLVSETSKRPSAHLASPRITSHSFSQQFTPHACHNEMGNSSSLLTQYDLEDLQNHCNNLYSQREIIALYERFCQLDRTGKGFISADEFMGVPEFAVNPLCQRLLKMLEGLNFKEFIALLSAFSARATKDDKLKFIFRVYDADGNGKVTSSDMLQVLRDLSGNFLTDEQRKSVLNQALEQAGYTVDSALTLQDFKTVLGKADLKMDVEVPVD